MQSVNILTFAHGCALGWLSPAILILQSTDSPMKSGPISISEVSWMGSILPIGGLIGNIFYSILSRYYGIRIALLLLPLPNTIYCLLVMFSDQVHFLYLARFMSGVTGGASLVIIPVFVAEIASDHVRGSLGYFYSFFMNFGILFAFLLGSYLPYRFIPYVMVPLPIINCLCVVFFPESPTFLLLNNKLEEAEKSFKFYRNCKVDQQRFTVGFDELKNNMEKRKTKNVDEIIRWADITHPTARRGIFISSFLMLLNISSGGFVLTFYTGTFFIKSGSTFDPNVSAIIAMLFQILGIYLASLMVDKFGRRYLLMFSTTVTGMALALTGIYAYLSQEIGIDLSGLSWIPVASLSAAMFCQSIGIFPLCFVIVSEVIPSKLRLFTSTYCMLLTGLFLFLASRYVLPLSELIGLYGCMWTFSGCSFVGLIFTIFILPETKGINLNTT